VADAKSIAQIGNLEKKNLGQDEISWKKGAGGPYCLM
jgi:hypothetical protein